MTVPTGPDSLAALVQRLPPISAHVGRTFPPPRGALRRDRAGAPGAQAGRSACQDSDATSHCELEETLQIAHDVWLVRRTGGFYIALVDVGHHVLPHLLDTGLGRLVWTLATARPMNSCERARRILAECGILEVEGARRT